jgi:predicted amidohydrolase
MRVAIAQLVSSPDKNANLAKARKYIAKAKSMDADLVVIPETYMAFLPPGVTYADVAESLDGPFVRGLAGAAAENRIYVVCGLYESKSGDPVRAYNTTVVLDRAGTLIHCYRKTHLYDAFAYKESASVIPGDEPYRVFEMEAGKIGLQVCYDIRFPEVSRSFALQGAQVMLVPTAWVAGPLKEEQFEILLRCRAIENTMYVCAANQVGNIATGRSMVIDPMGIIVASAGEEETILVADIDSDRVSRVREKNPSLDLRRPELYRS